MASALLPMAEVSYQKKSYLRARAFLQRYESVGPDTEESLYLGFLVESALGDSRAAAQYRDKLYEEFPGSVQAGLRTGQDKG